MTISADNFTDLESPSGSLTGSLASARAKSASKPQSNKAIEEVLRQSQDRTKTLFQRLLGYVMPTVLIPLVAASGVGYWVTQNRATDVALSELKERATQTSANTQTFLSNYKKIELSVTANTTVLQALREGARRAEAAGLPQLSVEQLEQKYKQTKVLQPNPELNSYLERIKQANGLAEIFITERNGYNIAYSNPTSDFVQAGEKWWEVARTGTMAIDDPEFDESANAVVIAMSQSIKDPRTGEFLGVVKAGVKVTDLNDILIRYFRGSLQGSAQIQIIDTGAQASINTLTSQGLSTKQEPVMGDKVILQVASQLVANATKSQAEVQQILTRQPGIRGLQVRFMNVEGLRNVSLEYQGRYYSLTPILGTGWVAIASKEVAQVNAAGQELLNVFALTAAILGLAATGVAVLMSRQFSRPILLLTESLNSLLQKQRQETEKQRQQKENLEMEVFQILEEVGDAASGDLTVRATLSTGDMGTVADLFNAVVESLRDITLQVKDSAGQVNSALTDNGESIRNLATQALAEVEAIRSTLGSVEEMSKSVQDVAVNAQQAAEIANDAFTTVQASTMTMDQTVGDILQLRNTVGETAKKMKRLGESSQKISQVVSLIEEIALKTSLLAINASVEAKRAGEQGQGFTVVAEQVGALAEQSATATKEIAQIVAGIQAETQEVSEAMEMGTAQVVESTRSVEITKQKLEQILEQSQEINQLMESISEATIAQSQTSQVVTSLMQQVTTEAETRAQFSSQVAESMQQTAQVAQTLETAVGQFKVS